MSIKKFGENDILVNTMKTHPRSEFFIYDGTVYYNQRPEQSGAYSYNVRNVGPGHISLYEYNIDKSATISNAVRASLGAAVPADDVPISDNAHGPSTYGHTAINDFIYPFMVKSSDRTIFRSAFTGGQLDTWRAVEEGTIFYGNYPMSASISREYWSGSSIAYDGKCGMYAAQRIPEHDIDDSDRLITKTVYRDNTSVQCATGTPIFPHYHALRSTLDFYKTRSEHYAVSSSLAPYTDGGTNVGWDKDRQQINAIMIPSIFYGSEIKPGSLSLKMFVTGTLISELRDSKQNGELIQISGAMDGPDAQGGSGSVAGVALYEEGILLLTGNWQLGATTQPLIKDVTTLDYPKWKYFGAGAADGLAQTTVGGGSSANGYRFISMSFDLSFEGTTATQVVTMFAHAERGKVNYSNNPTFIEYGQTRVNTTSSVIYEENTTLRLKNLVSSSFEGHSASFNRQVYISKIGIYDDKKKLIGVASLATPVLKKEDEDLTFKLKLDI